MENDDDKKNMEEDNPDNGGESGGEPEEELKPQEVKYVKYAFKPAIWRRAKLKYLARRSLAASINPIIALRFGTQEFLKRIDTRVSMGRSSVHYPS